MECVFGMVGNGFALVVADSSAVHSILVHKSNEDKIMILDSHKLMGASGEAGDRAQFTEYVQKNVALYQFRNGIPLTTAAAANFTRGELATALRKNPYMVNIILAGYDKETGPSLYYVDYIATLHKVDKAAFGYGSYFSLAMMDRHYRKDMTVEEAVDLADKCIMEIRSRLVVAPPNFVIKIVDKDGAREYAWRQSVKDAMAIANLQRFASRIARNPSISSSFRATIARSSATASSSPSRCGSAKVSDRIVKLFAVDPDGHKREIIGLSGQTLLKALTNHGLIDPDSHRLEDIDACSSECEVHIAQEWLEKLPEASYDEQYVLKRNSRARVLNKHSRLGCQVVLSQELQGMVVAIPEAKPWDIP